MDEPIWYVCKYTPLELLAGYGLSYRRLDPSPVDFTCAEGCAHPNMCGYGKAVLEDVIGKGLRHLLLVDCCDVCRRVYDVLLAHGKMVFLYLLPMPHKKDPPEQALLENDLRRLSCALEALTGRQLNEDIMLHAWHASGLQSQETAETMPYIELTGAHGGIRLRDMIRERSTLPVVDHTCTGSRILSDCEASDDGSMLFRYSGALLRQERPCMRMQFSEAGQQVKAAGVICHTVKFCDYYGFQYRRLKEDPHFKLLKIETDCTAQSSGQLRTRIDAFVETLGGKGTVDTHHSPEKEYVAGIDSGSTSTDVIILNRKREIVGTAILPTGSGAAAGAEKALSVALQNACLHREQIGTILTTGYGRETIGNSDASATEITCHARGAHALFSGARTVIDIGGQDSKVICLDEKGHVINFVMNDKCAAGTGRFLDMMARTMGLSLAEMSTLGLKWKHAVSISSMCTVFAESEVVSLIAENTEPADIIHGLNEAVAVKTSSLVKRAGGRPPYVMTGGVAQNQGVVLALEKKLDEKIHVPHEAQLCGAIGAALLALESNAPFDPSLP